MLLMSKSYSKKKNSVFWWICFFPVKIIFQNKEHFIHDCWLLPIFLDMTHLSVWILTFILVDFLFPSQINAISRGQRQVIHQLDNLTSLLHEHLALTRQGNAVRRNGILEMDMSICPLIALTIGGFGYLVFKSLNRS